MTVLRLTRTILWTLVEVAVICYGVCLFGFFVLWMLGAMP